LGQLETESTQPDADETSERISRLVDWSSDLLVKLLQEVAARRQAKPNAEAKSDAQTLKLKNDNIPLDEWKEIIRLPKFDKSQATASEKTVELPKEVKEEVKEFMTKVASLYHQVCSFRGTIPLNALL
jgi:macrodomain Ter protein organizer (MatP/YcbG family)